MWLQPRVRHDWNTVPFKTISEEIKAWIPKCLESQHLSHVLTSCTLFSVWKSFIFAFALEHWKKKKTSKLLEWPFWHCIQFYFSQLFGGGLCWVFQFCGNSYDLTNSNETQIKLFSDLLGCWSTWGRGFWNPVHFYNRISYLFINQVFSISSMNIHFISCFYLSLNK